MTACRDLRRPEPASADSLPRVGATVQYFNPAYSPSENNGSGVGPYCAFVTRSWDYCGSPMCNLAVVTPGKDALAHVYSVPHLGSATDDGKYPCWNWVAEQPA